VCCPIGLPRVSDEDTLLAQVLASPADDEPRRVYADWLTQRGDPRGEFIALQLRDTGSPEDAKLRDAAWELEKQYREAWVPKVKGLRINGFVRGFPEHVHFVGDDFAAGAAALMRSLPVVRVSLRKATDAHLERLAGLPELARLERLDLEGLHDEGFQALVASPNLSQLGALEVSQGALGPASMRALADASVAKSLRFLSVHRNPLEDAGLAAVARWPAAGRLRTLRLTECAFGGEGLRELLASPLFSQLEELSVASNRAAAGLGALARLPRASELRRLDLSGCAVRDADAKVLASSPALPLLEELNLSRNSLEDAGATALARSGHLPALEVLDLCANVVQVDGAQVLSESPGLPRLKRLGLSGNPIDVPGAREAWRDWDGGWVGDGPVKADVPSLRKRFGRRVWIT
jgi:uncharacterized protein (TIGR02996 family)